LRNHARPLFAATLGVAFGMSINSYTSSLFGAHLSKEFGWQRSDFALIGVFAAALLVVLPVVGRLTDRYGVRRTAAVGVFLAPLTYIAQSMATGSLALFFTVNCLQLFAMSFVTSTVFNRVVADRFISARGIAFAIVMAGPPLAGIVVAPVLGDFITAYGWRAGYWFMAAITFCFGLIALLMLPPDRARTARPSTLKADYALVAKSKVFWLITASMVLVNLPQALGTSQLMIMLADNGVKLSDAWYLSVYPLGVTAGRFITGYLLDRCPPHWVGMIGLIIPAIGFALLAGPIDTPVVISLADGPCARGRRRCRGRPCRAAFSAGNLCLCHWSCEWCDGWWRFVRRCDPERHAWP
jgi:MFS family permease